MNWNPFKRSEPDRPVVLGDAATFDLYNRVEKLERTSVAQAMEEIKGLRLLIQQLQTSVQELESNAKKTFSLISATPSFSDIKLQQKLEAEKEEHKRTYAREYYYRKKVNQPTMKQLAAKKKPKVTSNDSNVQAMDFSPVTARDGSAGNDKGTAGEAGS